MTEDRDRYEDLHDWYDEDDGAALLDATHAKLTRFVKFADEHQSVAVTLWIAATHALRAWQHATRLVITSPSKRCGKSRLLDIVAGLSFASLQCGDISPAATYRSIGGDDDKTPTLFLDEVDVLFGTKRAAENNEDLRGLLNNGWQRNRPTIRCVGPLQNPTPFNTFAMVALASKGEVLPDTVTDRAVNIHLSRRSPGEDVARFRLRTDQPELEKLSPLLTAWARSRADVLARAELELPGVEDRALDAWEPLVAIADAAAGRWPAKARAACRALSATDRDGEDLGALLLADIRRIFADADKSSRSFMPSNMLVHELRRVEESPWGDDPHPITASKLAKRLKPYRVRPGFNPAKTVRGYSSDSFRDPFRRYLRPEPSSRPKDSPGPAQTPSDGEDTQSVQYPSESVRTDGSGRVLDAYDADENTDEDAGDSDISDGWTLSDGYPERNGIANAGRFRRPGCVCAGQPQPCHFCQLAAQQTGRTA